MNLNKRQIKLWTKEHKKELIIAGAGVGFTIAGVVILRQNPAIVRKPLVSVRQIVAKPMRAVPDNAVTQTAEAAKSTILNNGLNLEKALKMRTGNTFSAAKLGERVGLSSQKFNQRLIDAGLAFRTPNGTLYPTEIGEHFYKLAGKETPWGKSIPFDAWDESIIGILFSKEELKKIATRMKMIKEAAQGIA